MASDSIPKKLRAKWSKRERGVEIDCPSYPDGHMLYGFLVCARDPVIKNGFLKTLEEYGYDLTTLKFSIEKKKC